VFVAGDCEPKHRAGAGVAAGRACPCPRQHPGREAGPVPIRPWRGPECRPRHGRSSLGSRPPCRGRPSPSPPSGVALALDRAPPPPRAIVPAHRAGAAVVSAALRPVRTPVGRGPAAPAAALSHPAESIMSPRNGLRRSRAWLPSARGPASGAMLPRRPSPCRSRRRGRTESRPRPFAGGRPAPYQDCH
jgi:hypothetical protein